jgi:hypothetical protein
MDTAIFQDVAMQSAETLRRAAERSMRGLRIFDRGGETGPDRCEALRQFLADLRADLTSLRVLRETANEFLREGVEADALLDFCEVALAAAEITMKGSAAAESAESDLMLADPEGGDSLIDQLKESSEQARAIHSDFRRLAEWLRTPPSPLPPAVLDQLNSLPPVMGPEGATGGEGQR